ncbi:MAG: single-stranded DNA-binding protein, partial [Clostridiales bacterium]|nr:single-stranded DNA-binding protein [Clostridiales bacterium]
MLNNVILMGRLTKAPEIRAAQSGLTIASYTLAVDRRFKREGEPTADFIPVKAFGKQAEFVEKYLKKGMKIAVTGRIETGSFTGKDGNRVYTWNVIADNHEFVESKGASEEHKE